MRLYHSTTQENAERILGEGFRDGRGTYMTSHEYTGVWLSDQPLDENEGASSETLLVVDPTESAVAALAACEWVEEGKGYREWLVPAAWLNERASVSVNRS